MRTSRLAAGAVLAFMACSRGEARRPVTQVLANLPISSMVSSLGSAYTKTGVSVAAAQNDEPTLGRFQDTYTVEFAAQPASVRVLDSLATRLKELVVQRGAIVTGESGDGETYRTLVLSTDSAAGWLTIVAAKPGSPGNDRYTILVTEVHAVNATTPR